LEISNKTYYKYNIDVGDSKFRSHNEKINSENRGNFLAVINLLAKYDPVLSKL